MELLAVTDRLQDFTCPACASERLSAADQGAVECEACGRAFPCREGVVDYVVGERLGATGKRERAANAVDLSSAKLTRRRIRKGQNNPLLMAQMRRSTRAALRLMADYDATCTLVSLGSGAGFELPLLLERRRFAHVYSSDLAWTVTALVPEVTGHLSGTLCLFAADFDQLPIRRREDAVGFVFLALHHSDDPHRSLQRLLDRNFDHLVMVEPVTNRLVEVLARVGLARRVEYSGTRPQWLDIARMRRIAAAQGYAMKLETWWEVPRDFLPRRVRKSRIAWKPPYALVAVLSRVASPFRFGSMAAIRFERRR